MYLLSQALPFVALALEPDEDSDPAVLPAWQTWSEAIASCLQQLAPVDAHMTEWRNNFTGRLVYSTTVTLLSATNQILRAAMRRGAEALQRPPLPALLAAVAPACRISPEAFELEREDFAEVRFGSANTACEAVAAVAAAVQGHWNEHHGVPPPLPPPPWGPQLLRSACSAIPILLRECRSSLRLAVGLCCWAARFSACAQLLPGGHRPPYACEQPPGQSLLAHRIVVIVTLNQRCFGVDALQGCRPKTPAAVCGSRKQVVRLQSRGRTFGHRELTP